MSTPPIGQKLKQMSSGAFITLAKIKPAGALQARKQTSGAVSLYWRYSIGSSSERVLIGIYDPTASQIKSLMPSALGYSIAAATRAAEDLAMEHHRHREQGGRPALVAANAASQRTAEEAAERAAKNTLRSLLTDYCNLLEALGRRSHKDASSIFNRHVFDANPALADAPANEIKSEEFVDLMRTVVDAGKGRTANKLRSYARAAYQVAKAAKSKASIPKHFLAYAVTTNPLADTEPDHSHNRLAKKPLSTEEMRKYWQIVKSMEGERGALLRLHILTGAQRIEQLVKLRTEHVADDHILLFDGKGRPGKSPREHAVPLINAARKALRDYAPAGEYALSTDGGETHVAATTLSKWSVEAVDNQIKGFQAKRLRSGVETLLAGAKVSREIRGRLQSHGISGVQANSYDGYDYLVEKRESLETLFSLLDRQGT